MEENQILKIFLDIDQKHIIEKYNTVNNEQKKAFIEQVNKINELYPGGLIEYYKKGKELLDLSKRNVNKYKDYVADVPEGYRLEVGSEEFYEMDKKGFDILKDTCFVLVAGGLGERLGYSDIKIGLETELITKRKFIEIYIQFILAYEERLRKKFKELDENWYIPFCIMTSGDTHDKTVKLLKENKNFGLKEGQIILVKQEKLPTFIDNECHLNLEKNEFLLETKPHGHGDVHSLLYNSGLAKKWVEMKKKYFILFQDTNGLVFNCFPSGLGMAEKYKMAVNNLSISRKPGEPICSIVKLNHKKNKREFIVRNIEYNELNSILKEGYNKDGDVLNEKGYSNFPGNLNAIIFDLKIYLATAEKTHGLVPEFINPKYTDESKTSFKSPTRLECLLQDFPNLLNNGETVSFTAYDNWFNFSTVKNNLTDGCAKLKKKLIPETAFSFEQDLFKFYIKLLKDIYGKLDIIENEPENEVKVLDINVKFGPKIILFPSFAPSISELKEKLENIKKIEITTNSSLIIKNNINIQGSIKINGNCLIEKDCLTGTICENKLRYNYIALKENEGEIYEKIRGYKMEVIKSAI